MLDPFVFFILGVLFVGLLFWGFRLLESKNVKQLHDEVIDQTTREVLEACLAYGQSRLTGGQYEVFKDLLTDQINNGDGGISLAKLVEDCIAQAQGETNEA